jgi:hypothetical protein
MSVKDCFNSLPIFVVKRILLVSDLKRRIQNLTFLFKSSRPLGHITQQKIKFLKSIAPDIISFMPPMTMRNRGHSL